MRGDAPLLPPRKQAPRAQYPLTWGTRSPLVFACWENEKGGMTKGGIQFQCMF